MKILILSADLPFEISELIQESLNNAGYRDVIVFSNPLMAHHYITSEQDISLIIFDYNMKDTGLDVSTFLTEITNSFPAIRLVIVTWELESVLEEFSVHPIVSKRESHFCDKIIHHIKQMTTSSQTE